MDLPKSSCKKETDDLSRTAHSWMAGRFLVRQPAPLIIMFDQWQTRYCFSLKQKDGSKPTLKQMGVFQNEQMLIY